MIAYRNGIYQGSLENGIKEGIGIFWWAQGAIYIGEWHKDMIHGEGIIMINDNVIRAQFKNNKFHGLCVNYTQSEFYRFEYGQLNGKCLKGQTVSVYRRGELICIENNLDSIDLLLDEYQNRLLDLEEILDRNQCSSIGITETHLGKMKRGKPYGLGIEKMFTFDKRIGIFHDQQISNIGQIWKNGDIYTGSFEDNKFHGMGTYFISAELKMIQGIFDRGKCIEIVKTQYGDLEAYKLLAEQTFQAIQINAIQSRVTLPYLQFCQFEILFTQTLNSISQIPTQSQEKDQTLLEVDLDIQKELEKISNDQQTIEAKKALYEIVNKNYTKEKCVPILQLEQLQTFPNNPSDPYVYDEEDVENLQTSYKSKQISGHTQKTEFYHVSDSKQNSDHQCRRLPLQILKDQEINNGINVVQKSVKMMPISARSDPYSMVLSTTKRSLYNQ
ncbi:unnamed protein product [Paramecium pentaurelia]|uniref:Uncharacterized protein n=1 Tax=Paramecium pentaurelia TaxID=43138 RepID=A0A8S1UU36_9CILI|nr:unnamed protein product [Paramecium pentaurelia]